MALIENRLLSRQTKLRKNETNIKAYLGPLILAYSIVVLLGFANGLLHATNKLIQDEFHNSKSRVAGFDAAGSVAFFIAPLTYGRWIVEKLGYRISFVIGLFLHGLGAILFWPFWHFHSFSGLCMSNFIVGSSTALMANALLPYIAGCGPSHGQEIRLNIQGGLRAVSSIMALVTAGFVFYGDASGGAARDSRQSNAQNVCWTYLSVACFTFVLGAVYIFVPIPEIADQEDEISLGKTLRAPWIGQPFRKQYLLFIGTATSFLWIGGEGSLLAFFLQYAQEADPRLSNTQAAHFKAINMALLAIGRFATALALKKAKPRHILLMSSVLTLVCLGVATSLRGHERLYLVMLRSFTIACFDPIIDSTSLRGLGKHSRKGASLLTMCVASISVFSPAFGAIADKYGTRLATLVTTSCTIVVLIYAITINTCFAKPIDALCKSQNRTASEEAESRPTISPATPGHEAIRKSEPASVEAAITKGQYDSGEMHQRFGAPRLSMRDSHQISERLVAASTRQQRSLSQH